VEQANSEARSQRILTAPEKLTGIGEIVEAATLGYIVSRSAQDLQRLHEAEANCRIYVDELKRLVGELTLWSGQLTIGLAAMDAMRGLPGMSAVPIVFFAANAGEELRHDLLRRGALGVIVKPVETDGLLAQIRTLWRQFASARG
jgi:CheY-like chemotaxis protein